MQITAEWLKQFCVEEETKFLKPSPYIFTHKDGRRFTVATDGRRMVIVNAMIEGVEERKSPDVTSFVDVERQGVEVSTYALKAFLECEKPTTEKCAECGGSGRIKHDCNCDLCINDPSYDACGCGGHPVLLWRCGYLNEVMVNRTYLADMMRDVEDETVLVHLTGEKMPVYVFTSAATFALMPMHDYGQSNDYPRFAVTQKVTMSVQCTKERR